MVVTFPIIEEAGAIFCSLSGSALASCTGPQLNGMTFSPSSLIDSLVGREIRVAERYRGGMDSSWSSSDEIAFIIRLLCCSLLGWGGPLQYRCLLLQRISFQAGTQVTGSQAALPHGYFKLCTDIVSAVNALLS
ncbi:hypothetical protein K432DRAFT_172277 [Lepidopterella palustris CBS 459.81]|uniref:Uncharacterized protein n=1 Tax=Lepidopterella palustris CBS 459.81 TaxID=1314670 RepID=A0A8E2EH29_9PEZI|nr:hypothetical protein K432DRAFT_172277 [Lepidopterella palustris CBS 459.81]